MNHRELWNEWHERTGFFFSKQSSDLRDYFIQSRLEQRASTIDRFIISSSLYTLLSMGILSA